MPKIVTIPTPPQARILKAFVDYPNIYVSTGYNGYRWIGRHYEIRNLEKPRTSAIHKMMKEGWLVEKEGGWAQIVASQAGLEAINDFSEQDFISVAKSGYNEEQVIEALKKRFCEPDWMFINPFYLSDGGWGKGRYADGFAFRIRAGDGKNNYLDRWAFEVKVDRSDFKKELENPDKRGPAMDICHYFAFVAPQGLILPSEVPDRCGLLEVVKNGSVRTKVRPQKLSPEKEVGWDLVAQIARYWIPNK